MCAPETNGRCPADRGDRSPDSRARSDDYRRAIRHNGLLIPLPPPPLPARKRVLITLLEAEAAGGAGMGRERARLTRGRLERLIGGKARDKIAGVSPRDVSGRLIEEQFAADSETPV